MGNNGPLLLFSQESVQRGFMTRRHCVEYTCCTHAKSLTLTYVPRGRMCCLRLAKLQYYSKFPMLSVWINFCEFGGLVLVEITKWRSKDSRKCVVKVRIDIIIINSSAGKHFLYQLNSLNKCFIDCKKQQFQLWQFKRNKTQIITIHALLVPSCNIGTFLTRAQKSESNRLNCFRFDDY